MNFLYQARDAEMFSDFQNWVKVPRKMGAALIRKIENVTRENGMKTMR